MRIDTHRAPTGVFPAVVVPTSRQTTETLTRERHFTRILTLAGHDPGQLFALPSPVRTEKVLVVYHLPASGAHQGDHIDTHYTRAALQHRWIRLGHPVTRRVPNGDIRDLNPVSLTDAGHDWLSENQVPGVAAELRVLDTRVHGRVQPRWTHASWRSEAR